MVKNATRYERGDVAVEWYNAGEGWDGDYNPDDPEDTNLLRFDFYGRKDGEWLPVIDGSYCTQVPVDTAENVLAELLVLLMDAGEDQVQIGLDEDRAHFPGEVEVPDRTVFEELSWISPDWVKTS